MRFTHVLITRPEPEASQLAARLAGTGLEPVVLPAYRFEPEAPGIDFSRAWRPGSNCLAVFSSTRAVEFGLRQLPAGFLDGVLLAALGPATARALDAAGHAVSVRPERGYDSEALLAEPVLARDPGDAVIFAAPGGRTKLERGLRQLGWSVRMAFVYRRVETEFPDGPVAALERAPRLVSVWTSASAVRALKAKLPAPAWARVCDGQCLATSNRLGKILGDNGARRVNVTDGPGNDALLRGILQLT